MAVCNGRGDVDGGHCCWIGGVECPLLDQTARRCTVWGRWDSPEYQQSAAAARMALFGEGLNCSDWPQNIPEVMAAASGQCCWRTNGNLG